MRDVRTDVCQRNGKRYGGGFELGKNRITIDLPPFISWYELNNITKLKRRFENSGYIFSISRTYFVGEKPVCFLNTAEK